MTNYTVSYMETLLEIVKSSLLMPADPSRRVFWLFLVSALVMASIAVTLREKRFDLRYQISQLFSRKYWLHPSNAKDLGLLLFNSSLKILFIVPLFGSYFVGAIAFGTLLQQQLGDAPVLQVSMLTIAIAYTLIFFLTEDLSRFSLHFCMHKIPFLWKIHQTHHSATNLTPLTVHRVHPVEMLLYYTRGFLVFSMVTGLFIYLFKGRVSGVDILGVDCLGFLFNFLGANLRHSPIWLSFGRLEKWFISPAQHQIHHSSAIEHHDKNFGTCLALWDKLAGSWIPANRFQKLTYGVAESPPPTTSTSASATEPRPQTQSLPSPLA